MNERLFGLREQRRMPLDGDRLARSREREHALLEVGAGLGMETVRARGGDFLAEERPGQTEVLRRVFDLPEDRGLGEAVYGMFSAVAHGTSFGLSDSVSVDSPEIPDRTGVTMGAVFTSSGQVVSVLCPLALSWGLAIAWTMMYFAVDLVLVGDLPLAKSFGVGSFGYGLFGSLSSLGLMANAVAYIAEGFLVGALGPRPVYVIGASVAVVATGVLVWFTRAIEPATYARWHLHLRDKRDANRRQV
jgi:hypothetical protein